MKLIKRLWNKIPYPVQLILAFIAGIAVMAAIDHCMFVPIVNIVVI